MISSFAFSRALIVFMLVFLKRPVWAAVVPHPIITPPSLAERSPSKVQERGIVSDIEALCSYLSSVVGTFPAYIEQRRYI